MSKSKVEEFLEFLVKECFTTSQNFFDDVYGYYSEHREGKFYTLLHKDGYYSKLDDCLKELRKKYTVRQINDNELTKFLHKFAIDIAMDSSIKPTKDNFIGRIAPFLESGEITYPIYSIEIDSDYFEVNEHLKIYKKEYYLDKYSSDNFSNIFFKDGDIKNIDASYFCSISYKKCSKENRLFFANEITAIFTTIFRIFMKCIPEDNEDNTPESYLWDAQREFLPFEKSFYQKLFFFNNHKGCEMNGSAFLPYHVTKEAQEQWSISFFKNIFSLCINAFSNSDKTLYKHIALASIWMQKARVSYDDATRFLFYFTAIEAIFTTKDKTSPVTDTISRHMAVCFSNQSDERFQIFNSMKEFYKIRSKIVHGGFREIDALQTKQLQRICERLVFNLSTKYSNDISIEEFHKELKEKSFGGEW